VVGPEVAYSFLRLPCRQYDVRPADKTGTYIRPGDRVIRVEIDRRGQTQAACACYIEPTDEQIEQDRRETEAAMQRTYAAIRISGEWRVKPKPQQDRREVVACPACSGKLHLFQSAYNGHVHGQCETKGYVSWME
jgi:hypothetical protein